MSRRTRTSFFSCRILSVRLAPTSEPCNLLTMRCFRLYTSCSGVSIPLLHATPSPPLQLPLLHIMPSGCARRMGCAQVPAINQIWRRTGHDHRSLHHDLSSCIPGFRKTRIQYDIPMPDQLGLRQPLLAYVCHSLHGRARREP